MTDRTAEEIARERSDRQLADAVFRLSHASGLGLSNHDALDTALAALKVHRASSTARRPASRCPRRAGP